MIAALLSFLIGCLIVAVCLYVFKLVLDMIQLPQPVGIAVLILVALVVNALGGVAGVRTIL